MKPFILEFQKDFLTHILLLDSNKFQETINRKYCNQQLLILNRAVIWKDSQLTNDATFFSLNEE